VILDVTTDPNITRRSLLIVGAGGAGAVVLAACSNGSSDSGSAAASNSAGGGSSGPAGTTSSAGSSAGKSAADNLGALSGVPVGQAKAVTLPNGKPGILARPTATTAACFSAICTHMGCTVNADGNKLNCPCHGSQYDALTGKVLRGPAPSPLPSIPVTVTGGNVIAQG
jgi:cytochrome b6-f complex iron-sulfur subunit